ncbi:hypothetical protein SG34_015305 [Thalassomonas viridans]|uniref:Uncharacterized protein n=1 Tax=Thalassomonas viridans TaxID=137584 RepID=A0AAE9YX51_9GAMM|nr:hypothetical protein [Thalassomonas viridans]WDE02811.1 hypothetical protein SG34_015305 [Thalassomonas viridans]
MNFSVFIVACLALYYLLDNLALAGIPEHTPSVKGFRWWSTPIEYAGRLYFTVDNYNTSNRRGVLYYYDDSANKLIKVDPTTEKEHLQNISKPVKFAGRLFFWAKVKNDLGYWHRSLYSYDALSESLLAHDIELTTEEEINSVSDFKVYDHKLFFGAKINGSDRKLWSYDPFNRELTAITPLPPEVKKGRLDFDESFNDTLSFTFLDFDGYRSHHYIYDRKNNTVSGREVPYAINSETLSAQSSQITYLGEIYGSCQNPDNGGYDQELCLQDKDGKISLVADIDTASQGSSVPGEFVHYADALYFTANNSGHGRSLHKYDVLTQNISTVPGFSGKPSDSYSGNLLAEYNGKLYFTLYHYDSSDKKSSSYLWSYDVKTGQYQEIGGFAVDNTAALFLTEHNDKLYVGLSSRAVYVYDSKTEQLSPWQPQIR